jgi:hypothetical protein
MPKHFGIIFTRKLRVPRPAHFGEITPLFFTAYEARCKYARTAFLGNSSNTIDQSILSSRFLASQPIEPP